MRPLRDDEDFPDPKAVNPEVARMDGRALFERLRSIDPDSCTALYLAMMGHQVPEIAILMRCSERRVDELIAFGRAALCVSI